MCGEKACTSLLMGWMLGSPPHVRGKGRVRSCRALLLRITPAYAGKRARPKTPPLTPRDHPRMCGEKSVPGSAQSPAMGSPPHVRGKGVSTGFARAYPRITPAYAGKRADAGWIWSRPPDHPRVCGEKPALILRITWLQGSPPRMRGKVCVKLHRQLVRGITPAYAGKRCRNPIIAQARGDHPRVCGEKNWSVGVSDYLKGSPPRMRGKDPGTFRTVSVSRITPRMRGKDSAPQVYHRQGGITPAYAGKRTLPFRDL